LAAADVTPALSRAGQRELRGALSQVSMLVGAASGGAPVLP
jgi:hypothetical protein